MNTLKLMEINKDKNEKYYELINTIKKLNLENKDENKRIIEDIDNYIEILNKNNALLNEKFYKNGFKDGICLAFECI